VSDLDSASFASTTGFDLGLYYNGATNLGSCCFGLFWGVRD
jgi:hypothetical protein